MLALAWLSPWARAHSVKVFAVADGRTVACRGYFSHGAPAVNCPIRVVTPEGKTLVQGKTDEKGTFLFETDVRVGLKIILNAGPGHRAEHTLSADDVSAPIQSADEPASRQVAPTGARNESLASRLDLLGADREGPGLIEIMGGLVCIAGLAGMVVLLRNHRMAAKARSGR